MMKSELVSELILHDFDCADEMFMDAPPEKMRNAKRELGIIEDYYTAVPPLLNESEKAKLLAFREALLAEKP